MASERRQTRQTAKQAMELFHEIAAADEEETDDNGHVDESDSESESDCASCDFASTYSDSSSDSDSDLDTHSADQRGASPQPGPSRRRPPSHNAKRPRITKQTTTSTRDADDGWISVSVEDRPRPSTSQTFDFLPKNRRPPGVNADLTEQSTPIDCFSALFDEEVCNLLITAINDYATVKVLKHTPARMRSRFGNWVRITKCELFKFLAVTTAMGLDKRPSIKDYYSTHIAMRCPFYGEMFSRERFEMLYSTMLHVGEPDAAGKAKIEPFSDMLVEKFNKAFTPFEHLSIDEMVVGWKGRWKYKQYNPSKPHKYHIKSFGLTDSATGYVLNVLTYYGANTSYDPSTDVDSSHAKKIFTTLLLPIGTGYHIYADRWYTTRVLIDYLISKQFHYTGTVQTNRVGFPAELKTMNLKHMESKYWTTQDKSFLCLAWKDKKSKKPVVIVSSNTEAQDIVKRAKTKPAVIDDYNMHMNGCDRADQAVGYYGLHTRKSCKWWKKLFHWLMEITVVNAYKLFVLTRPVGTSKSSLSLCKFKLDLIDDLCTAATELLPPTVANTTPLGGRPRSANPVARLEYTKHMIVYTQQDRRCKVCSTPNKKTRTNFVCEGCDGHPHLHPKACFKLWHTKADLSK